MNRQKVIVIGAGAAGLAAAQQLAPHFSVTILESEAEAGGRIKSIPRDNGEGVVEMGPEFVHGKLPITLALVKEAGLTLVKMEGRMYRKEGKDWTEQTEMIEGWDQLLETMKGVEQDMTMQEFLDRHFNGDEYADLRRHAKLYAQGFDVADPAKVSIQSLYREWSEEEDEQSRLKEGYGGLIALMQQKATDSGCSLLLNEKVQQVDWQENDVTVYTASGKKYDANKLLVTLPVAVMADAGGPRSVNFTPPIDEQIAAYRNIGFGNVVKVVLEFTEAFWKKDMGFVFSDEMIPTWWSQYPLKNHLLTGWAGGPVADRIASHTDQELLQIAMNSVANIFDTTISKLENNLVRSFVFNWSGKSNAGGAYSYATPLSNEARKTLNRPLAGTVFFAGEGLFEGNYPGTVEAALNSGRTAAEMMVKSLT